MKWLGAGVTFFNLSTVAGLLLGILAGGLTPAIAAVSLLFGAAMALYLLVSQGSEAQLIEPAGKTKGSSRKTSARQRRIGKTTRTGRLRKNTMPLTKDFRETIRERAQHEPRIPQGIAS